MQQYEGSASGNDSAGGYLRSGSWAAAPALLQDGRLMEQKGRVEEAKAIYLAILQGKPMHREALNDLGNLLFAQGRSAEARPYYEAAVASHPKDPMSLVNLGNLLMKLGEPTEARKLFEGALDVDPHYRPAHAGMSFALSDLGDSEVAAEHRRIAFQNHCVVSAPYRGAQPPITVLELVSTIGGNIRTQEFLSDRIFKRFLVATEFYHPGTVLPPHDLVVNAIGDVDVADDALAVAESMMGRTGAPVINHPTAVRATSRCAIAERLAGVANVVTPKTVLLSRDLLEAEDAEAVLSDRGFEFPMLLRSPGFHGGEHFVKVEAGAQLRTALADLPGEQVLVIQYLDARRRDGKIRKYRVMMVDGRIYPLHVAVSWNWKIHYFSAEMADHAVHRAEDAAFLGDMAGALGPRATVALEEIQATLGLDYGGIDFGLNEDGEVLLFEANATMAVVVPDKGEQWEYRRGPVETIYKAVWMMLMSRGRKVREEIWRDSNPTAIDDEALIGNA
jgi:Tfp pilus assembly protein PilF